MAAFTRAAEDSVALAPGRAACAAFTRAADDSLARSDFCARGSAPLSFRAARQSGIVAGVPGALTTDDAANAERRSPPLLSASSASSVVNAFGDTESGVVIGACKTM